MRECCAGFEAFTTVIIQIDDYWIATQCGVAAGYQRFRYPCCLHLHGALKRWYPTTAVKVETKLSLCLNKHHAMKMYCRIGGIAPHLLNLGTTWKWVVIFMPQPLYPQGMSPWYPLDRKLSGPQSWSGCGGEEKKVHHWPCQELNPDHAVRSLISMLTELPCLLVSYLLNLLSFLLLLL